MTAPTHDAATPRPPADDAGCVRVRGASKAFGGVQALDGVGVELRGGEIHALCGENGAGKSTLIKILAGALRADEGTVRAWGRPLPPGSVPSSEAAGIAVIHQELAAFPELDAVDNIFAGRELCRLGGLLLDRRRMQAEAARLLASLHGSVDLRVPVGGLSVAERQLVCIARALSHDCRLLVLDEPTASLSARDADALFGTLRGLRREGVGILYVSHRLEEVFTLADRVTVLRDGRLVATRPVEGLTKDDLVRLMVGREVDALVERRATPAPAARERLRVSGLSRRGAFRDIGFTVHAGEVLGLAGLVGAGRSEVARCVMGLDRPDGGSVAVDGRPLGAGGARQAIRRGLGMVPEDRQQEGLVLPMSVRENLCMVALRTLAAGLVRDRGRERSLAGQYVEKLGVRTPGLAVAAETLSGGNQQKLSLGKWLSARPKVLILDEPTHGVDVAAKAEIHHLVLELADSGIGVLLISSELPELLSLSDRILVLREGRIAGELAGEEATQEEILRLALPAAAAREAGQEAP